MHRTTDYVNCCHERRCTKNELGTNWRFFQRSTIFQRVPKQKTPFKTKNGISDLTITLQRYINLSGEEKTFDPSSACLVRRT